MSTTAAARAARIEQMEIDNQPKRKAGPLAGLAKAARSRVRHDAVSIHGQMVQLNEERSRNGGIWSAEQHRKFDKLNRAYDSCREQLKIFNDLRKGIIAGSVQRDAPGYRALDRAIRLPLARLTEEEIRLTNYDVRAQSIGTDTAGGFAVPDAAMGIPENSLLQFGGLRRAPITVLRTDHGRPLPIPTTNDTANSASLLAENTGASDQDVTFGQIVLNAYKFTSKIVKVSQELLDDAEFDVVGFVLERVTERIARGLAPYLIDGDGVAEPSGLDMSTSFVTAAAASAITRTDILDLIHAVDPFYRQSPSMGLVISDSTLKSLRKLTVGSSDDRPLWEPSMRDGEPDTIEGLPYTVVVEVQAPGGGNHSAYAGAFDKFVIREAGALRIKRLDERYGEADQVAFVAFQRFDSAILDPGTSPILTLRHPTS